MMRWLKWGMLEGMSPLGVLVAGLVIGTAGMPVIKKGLRGLAFTTTKAVMAVTDHVKGAGESLGQEWKQMVGEVASKREQQKTAMKAGMRGAGVGVISAGIGLAEQAKGTMQGIKEGWRDLVEEARSDLKGAAPAAAIETTGATPPSDVNDRVEEPKKEIIKKSDKISKEKNEDAI